MLMIWGNVDPKASYHISEPDLNSWWTNEHLLERLAIPGFLKARRFWCYDNHNSMSQYLVWYEAESLSTFTSAPYMYALNHPTKGTANHMPALAKLNRSACRILFAEMRQNLANAGVGCTGSTVAHIVFKPQGDFSLLEQKVVEMCRQTLSRESVVSVRVLEHDDNATAAGNTSKSYENTRMTDWNGTTWFSEWQLVIEYAEPMGAPFAEHLKATDTVARELRKIGMHDVKAQHYQLVCAMSR